MRMSSMGHRNVTIHTCSIIGYGIFFLPCAPVTLYKSPLSIDQHSIPCVSEGISFKLHTRFITNTLRFSMNLYTMESSITANVSEISPEESFLYFKIVIMHVVYTYLQSLLKRVWYVSVPYLIPLRSPIGESDIASLNCILLRSLYVIHLYMALSKDNVNHIIRLVCCFSEML